MFRNHANPTKKMSTNVVVQIAVRLQHMSQHGCALNCVCCETNFFQGSVCCPHTFCPSTPGLYLTLQAFSTFLLCREEMWMTCLATPSHRIKKAPAGLSQLVGEVLKLFRASDGFNLHLWRGLAYRWQTDTHLCKAGASAARRRSSQGDLAFEGATEPACCACCAIMCLFTASH